MVGVNVIDRFVIAAKVKRILYLTGRDVSLLKGFGKVVLSTIAAGVITILARNFIWQTRPLVAFLICGSVFSTAYIVVLLLTGAVTADERHMLNRQLFSVLRGGSSRRANAIAEASDAY